MKVLIVEHSRLQQTVLAKIFSSEGIIVSIASNYNQAMDRLNEEKIDIVCISYQLCGSKNGIDLSHEIRQIKRYSDIPIMLISSVDKDISTQYAYNAGVTEICNRSSIDSFSKKIKAILRRRNFTISANILFVEDSKTAAFQTMNLLKNTNIVFDHFYSADEAYIAYTSGYTNYDMIITDVAVEGKLDGLGFVRAVRQITPENYKLPILAVSSFDDSSRRVELLHSGANDYIVKPYVKEELMVRIKNLITTKNLFDQVAIQQEQLYKQAMKDHLTGLHNRYSLESFLPKINNSARYRNKMISILFFDIDYFKKINDKHGHSVGDSVLEIMGELINRNFNGENFCARYGGEEFIALIFNYNPQQTIIIAENFRKKIADTDFSGLKITISIGTVSSHISYQTDVNQLINRADEALYKAKAKGRNQVCSVDLR